MFGSLQSKIIAGGVLFLLLVSAIGKIYYVGVDSGAAKERLEWQQVIADQQTVVDAQEKAIANMGTTFSKDIEESNQELLAKQATLEKRDDELQKQAQQSSLIISKLKTEVGHVTAQCESGEIIRAECPACSCDTVDWNSFNKLFNEYGKVDSFLDTSPPTDQ
ncbi:hypothetical protein KAR91_10960 [Candidatus Pacearchaeota archaeon]|nr:hypothetical protein [Candidatus Pacearchaeota archaeon]